jgi:hypothetical protein
MWGDNNLRLAGLALLAVLVAGLAVERYWIFTQHDDRALETEPRASRMSKGRGLPITTRRFRVEGLRLAFNSPVPNR